MKKGMEIAQWKIGAFTPVACTYVRNSCICHMERHPLFRFAHDHLFFFLLQTSASKPDLIPQALPPFLTQEYVHVATYLCAIDL